MANEIRVSGTLTISKGGYTATGNGSQTLDMTGDNFFGEVINISSSYEQVTFTDMSDVRYLYIGNIDTGSAVIWAATGNGTGIFAKLQPDDFVMIPLSGSSLWLQASGSTVSGTNVIVCATET